MDIEANEEDRSSITNHAKNLRAFLLSGPSERILQADKVEGAKEISQI